ncbi:uncharacterized protein LOC133780185 [Humulus lupulus]|uniref:uncharacterized protein LOC133780185 n=1 Tax=Humulus lupulus TaxID=3486 RepID=UPI002B416924|nr:uncharacterized protein LOC133780185 [Humulus lupulus]
MSIISWNFRGLGNPWAVQFLKDLVVQKRPKYVFLCETLCSKEKVEHVRRLLHFEGSFSIDSQGRSGGIALLCKVQEEVTLVRFSHNHIDVRIHIEGSQDYRLTGLYGEPKRSLRKNTWDLIKQLKEESMLPWCIIGDLNNVLSMDDKRGGRPYPNWLIHGFQEVVDECGLLDLELEGNRFTWEKGQGTEQMVEVRLDRALVSQSWYEMFNMAKLFNLDISTSDHTPLLLDLSFKLFVHAEKRFKFENAWLREPMCKQLVKESWEACHNSDIGVKLKHCSGVLWEWGKAYTGCFKERIGKCKKVLKKYKSRRDDEAVRRYKEAQKDLHEVYSQREVFWRQRSKQLWLKAGDQNSKYFHAAASTRRRNNQIHSLLRDDGVCVEWENGLSEVKEALFQMNPDKSPGPDGMSPGFYQRCWDIVGRDVVDLVLSNRLKNVLAHIISDAQSAFIPGRLITDNIMVSFEVMHYLKKKRSGKDGCMALKLDMSKCVVTVRYMVVHGSKEIGPIVPGREAGEDCMYLGLPNIIGRNKTVVLGFLKDRIRKRIQGWDAKLLSRAGKEILLKTVAQSLSNYAMSVFLLPVSVCSEMERLMNKFWWKSSSSDGSKGIQWMSWNRLSSHKNKGGMGFRHLRDFNIALLGKQAWRLITNPDSLVGRVYKARYYPQGSFLEAELGSNPSFVWRCILESKAMMGGGLRRRVGSGVAVSVLRDPWLPNEYNQRVSSNHPALVDIMVSSLMIPGQITWDEDLDDTWAWGREKYGHYTVTSAYRLLQEGKEDHSMADNSGFWKKLWQLKVPPKVKDFLWRAVSSSLPTKFQLRIKKVEVGACCPWCLIAPETTYHVLVECAFVQEIWSSSGVVMSGGHNSSFGAWLHDIFQRYGKEKRVEIAMLCWSIWGSRNALIWKQKNASVQQIKMTAAVTLEQWCTARDSTEVFMDSFEPGDGLERWTKPDSETLKVNINAALFAETGRYSFAFVIRNHNGSLLEARTMCKPGAPQPEVAEGIDLKEALSWLQ